MDSGPDLVVRTMKSDELALVMDWASQEGWNPGLADGKCFLAADPAGFLLGLIAGEPVGCISVVRYGDRFGFLGLYIVKTEMRGRGYGWQIWQAGMERLKDRTIGLDGVVAQQDNYKRSGFVLAHRNIRFGGQPACARPRDASLTPIGTDLIPKLRAYDRSFFPAPRDAFLRCWLEPDQRAGFALVEHGSIRGYGVIRACPTGSKIGPLFAETEAGADLLFRALAAMAPDGPVFLDCPEPNPKAIDLTQRYALSALFETARMYRGPAPPDLPLSQIYGITTLELG